MWNHCLSSILLEENPNRATQGSRFQVDIIKEECYGHSLSNPLYNTHSLIEWNPYEYHTLKIYPVIRPACASSNRRVSARQNVKKRVSWHL